MSKTTSRRAILGAAVAAGAMTGAAAGVAIATAKASAASTDAELLALGKELHAAILSWRPLHDEDCRLGNLAHDLANERSGGCQIEGHPTKDEARRFVAELGKAEIELGWREAGRAERDASKVVTDLIDRVEVLAPTTPEGVGVRALAVAFGMDCAGYWDDPEFPNDAIGNFVSTCLAAAGIANPFMEGVQS